MSTRKSPILSASGEPFEVSSSPSASGRRYETAPLWLSHRHWEAGETNRLNEAHWSYATQSDRSINDWLSEQLATIRARSTYEARQNPDIAGMFQTFSDDVVGADGPTLEIQSDNPAYNEAAEQAWRDWFKAPTFRPNISGAMLLRLWVDDLVRCGEFLAQITTDEQAAGLVKMRLRPKHPRDLQNPTDSAGNPKFLMGVEFETTQLDRPLRYWLAKTSADGYMSEVEPWPAELVIHEFMLREERQVRGYPWITPSLQPAADTRDYDDQVQDAARLMADQACLLFNRDPAEPAMTPESTTFERRTIKMAPPGWEPYALNAAQPPVQYGDYRAERLRQIARPLSMPLMIMRLDASRHNYSSARFDGQGWQRFVQFIQTFLSGSEKSVGTLGRLVDVVLAEARFSIPALRNRPAEVSYLWTWPVRPHVDSLKEAAASEKRLATRQSTLTEELAERGKSIDTHIKTLLAEKQKFEQAGLPLPAYMRDGTPDSDEVDPNEEEKMPAEANSG